MNKIFTFYSFKGGVGRSMALANIAELLYRKGKRVVVIDWDLEAPGLEDYFFESKAEQDRITSKAGLIDILESYKAIYPKLSLVDQATPSNPAITIERTIQKLFDSLKETKEIGLKDKVKSILSGTGSYDCKDEDIEVIATELNKYFSNDGFQLDLIQQKLMSLYRQDTQFAKGFVISQFKTHLPSFIPLLQRIRTGHNEDSSKAPGLWILSAGMRDENNFSRYVRAIQDFSWVDFYESYNGEAYFDWMREELKNFADIILIDSRTGVTEMGSICIRQLSDTLILVTAPNHQNISGIEEMVKSITRTETLKARDNRPLDIIIIPSRLDNSEIRDLNNFQSQFKEIIGKLLGQEAAHQFWEMGIPYVPYYTYHEELVAGATSSDLNTLKDSRKSGQLEMAYLKLISYMFQKQIHDVQPVPEKEIINPFIGLKPFKQDETKFFYGRSEEIKKMLDIITRNNFLIVTGPSGSGKTSTVNAGLIPAMKKTAADEQLDFSIITLKVGNKPVQDLHLILSSPADNEEQFEKINNSSGNISAEFTPVASDPHQFSKGHKRVIFIDQLEEIFALAEEERKEFFEKLNYEIPKRFLVLILSVRIDFCRKVTKNISTINADHFIVNLGFLSEAELRKTILEPASKTDLKFEQGLVERILKDVEQTANKLPAIQLILQELWSRRRGDLLTHAAYDQITSVESLEQKIRNISKTIPPVMIEPVKPIVTRLVNIHSRTRQTLEISDYDLKTEKTIKPFLEAGLLVVNYNEKTNSKTIELAHDMLITHWQVLKDWLDKDAEFYAWRQKLSLLLSKWKENEEKSKFLLNYTDAREANHWLKYHSHDLMEDEIKFIRKSTRMKRLTIIYGISIFLIVLAAFFGGDILNGFKSRKVVREFKAALMRLDQMGSKQKQDSICILKDFENPYKSEFIDAAKDSLKELCYQIRATVDAIAPVVDSNNKRISELANQIYKEADANKNLQTIDSLELAINNKTALINTELDGIKKSKLQEDTSKLSARINEIVAKDALLSKANQANENIRYVQKKEDSLTKTNITQLIVKEDSPKKIYSKTTWFKGGYFLQFENIKVALMKLEKDRGIEIMICDETGTGPCKNPIGGKSVRITENNAYNFSYGNFDYVIKLDRIGRAGRNVFNAAAYITFEKYQKK